MVWRHFTCISLVNIQFQGKHSEKKSGHEWSKGLSCDWWREVFKEGKSSEKRRTGLILCSRDVQRYVGLKVVNNHRWCFRAMVYDSSSSPFPWHPDKCDAWPWSTSVTRRKDICAPFIFTFASAELLAGSKHLHSNDIQGILYDLWSKWYLCQDSFACFKASKWLINIFVGLTDCFSFLLNNIYWHTAAFVSHSTEIKSRQDLMKYDWQRSLWIQGVIIIAEIHLDRPISGDIFLCKSQFNSSGS